MSLADWLLPSEGRLTPDDISLLARLVPHLPQGFRVGHLQPSRSEQRALPHFAALSERAWDLSERRAPEHEVVLAGRLPGFALESELRFQNALRSCRLLIVLDAAAADPNHPRLLAEVPVSGGRLRLYRGDFTDPLLRVDDYPTGVRPILKDLGPLHEVLTRIDEAGLPFHLGVVPAILEERMVPVLRGLSQLVVSMHGYEHGYAKHSKVLLDAGDPFNQRGTVSGFDEFAGQSYEQILEQLRAGREILQERLGQVPESYIPPCNEGNRHTGRALQDLGFRYLLSEKPVKGCTLPVIGSDFYDRTSAFRAGSAPNVASLHATWEADMLRAGDNTSLPTFLSAMVAQRARARATVNEAAQRVADTLARG